jgi:hypothetical protein
MPTNLQARGSNTASLPALLQGHVCSKLITNEIVNPADMLFQLGRTSRLGVFANPSLQSRSGKASSLVGSSTHQQKQAYRSVLQDAHDV